MNNNSNKENMPKKNEKFKALSEEEFNEELKKQVDNLKKIFDDYNKKNQETLEYEER